MNTQPFSITRGQGKTATIRVELGGAPLDLSTASAATLTFRPSELSTAVLATKSLGSGVTAGALGYATVTLTAGDTAAIDAIGSGFWSLVVELSGVPSFVAARGTVVITGPALEFPSSTATPGLTSVSSSDITDAGTAGKAVLTAETAAQGRTALGIDNLNADIATAQAAARIYASTTAGIAATTDGQYFYVPSTISTEGLILYKNASGTATESKRLTSVESRAQIFERNFNSAIAGGNGTLKALWHIDSPKTYHLPGILSSWASRDQYSLSAGLYATIFNGADPRPVQVSDGVFFNSQAGLSVSNGLLTKTTSFCLFYVVNFSGITVTEYATKAAADAAVGSHVAGDVCKVVADVNSTYSPDIADGTAMQSGLIDSVLVNGYYVHSNGAWTNPKDSELWSINGSGGAYITASLDRVGQLRIVAYSGSGSAAILRTIGTNMLATSGKQMVAMYRDSTHFRLFLNGLEIHAVKNPTNATTLNTFLFNGNSRAGIPATPVGGFRQTVSAFSVVEDVTWIGFRGSHDALANYVQTPVLDIPTEMFGMLASGQSWWQGSNSVTDPWSTPTGWNGKVTQESVYSGTYYALTRDFIPHVYAHRSQDNNDEIGTLCTVLSGVGTISAGESHRSGPTGETWEWSGMRHITGYRNAQRVDWFISSSGSGGTTLAQNTAESSPAPIVHVLKSTAKANLTLYEKLLQAVVYARDFARSRGQRYSVKLWHWQQGHGDNGNTSYATQFITHYDKLNAAIKRITGQSDDVICLIPQINYSSNGTSNGANASGGVIDQQMLEIVSIRGTRPIFCYAPMYQITNFIHPYRAGHRWIGEIMGNAAKAILWDGYDWMGVSPKTFTLGENYVDIDFYVPVAPLQFATNANNIDALLTNKGFEFTDTSGGGVTITGVTLTDADTVRISLSGAPAAGDVVKYTGATCRYGNLCDSDTTVAYYKDQDWTVPLVSGSPIHKDGLAYDLKNWCCAFTKTL